MTAALLPYLCCRWLEQAVLYNVNHSDVALRTPFHALPFWLLDERCGAAMTATRHLVSRLLLFCSLHLLSHHHVLLPTVHPVGQLGGVGATGLPTNRAASGSGFLSQKQRGWWRFDQVRNRYSRLFLQPLDSDLRRDDLRARSYCSGNFTGSRPSDAVGPAVAPNLLVPHQTHLLLHTAATYPPC